MDEASKGMEKQGFRDRKLTGDPEHPAANGVSPSPTTGPNDCLIPLFCDNGNGNGNGGRPRYPTPTTDSPGGTGGGDGVRISPSPTRRE
jgi:hypothetical protein